MEMMGADSPRAEGLRDPIEDTLEEGTLDNTTRKNTFPTP